MEREIEDVLYAWAVHQFPYLLQDPELFAGLTRFITAVVAWATGEAREEAIRRAVLPSWQ